MSSANDAHLLTIGQISKRAGIATSALRFYERNGLLDPIRTSGGQRRYEREAIRRVSFIKAAQAVGISLADIRAALEELPGARTPTQADWKRISTAWRPMLDQRIASLELLKEKLDGCIGCGCLSLDRCALYNPNDAAAGLGVGARYLMGDTAADLPNVGGGPGRMGSGPRRT